MTSRPIKAYWEISPKYPHKCLNDGDIVFAASVINIFTDFLVIALPMPLIWSLKLPARQRLAVISIFGLGIIVNVAGSVRTVYVWKSMVVGYESTWLGWPVLVAAAVEINLGLVRCKDTDQLLSRLTQRHQSDLFISPSPPSPNRNLPPPSPQLHPKYQLLLQQPKPLPEALVLNRLLPKLAHGRPRLSPCWLRKRSVRDHAHCRDGDLVRVPARSARPPGSGLRNLV